MRVCRSLGRGNFSNKLVTEFIPWEKALLAQKYCHGKYFSLPRIVEDQLPTPARERGGPWHFGNCWVGLTVHSR